MNAVDFFVIGGDELRNYFVTAYAGSNGYTMQTCPTLALADAAMADCEPKYLIYDCESASSFSEAETVSKIASFAYALDCEVIVFGPGYNREMAIINSFVAAGAKYFIFSDLQGEQIEELDRIVKGAAPLPEKTPSAVIREREEREAARDIALSQAGLPDLAAAGAGAQPQGRAGKRKISVFGVCDRVGTTTVALQLCKYFLAKEQSVCYIELNGTGFASALTEIYNVEPGDAKGSFVCRSVPIYSDPGTVNKALAQNYDCYVYDCGSVTSPGFSESGAADKDITICVFGDSPLELIAAADVFPFTDGLEQPFFIFNLVHENDRENILRNMSGKGTEDSIYFAGYSPQPFVLSSETAVVFDGLLDAADRGHPKKEGRRWFKR